MAVLKQWDGAGWVEVGGTSAPFDLAATTHAATDKTTPVDADELPLADSAASFGLKKLSWANLKATANTLYAAIGHTHAALVELGYVQSTDSTDRTQSSTTAADVNALSLTITCPATPVVFELQIDCYVTGGTERFEFLLYDVTGSAVVASVVVMPLTNDNTYRYTFRITPAATGSRTYKVQVRAVDGLQTLHYRAFPASGTGLVVPYSLRAVG